MKRAILSIILVLFFCTSAFAEALLWKVQKDKSVLYLGATFHILRESDYPLPPEYDRAYKASDTLVFETDIGRLQDPSVQKKMLARSTYADGSTLDKHLSASTYGKLSAYCEANKIPLKAFRTLKPWMLMVTLTFMELMKLGVTEKGVDQYFYSLAQKDKKAVEGLETLEEQIDYVTSMSDGNEDDFVVYSIDDLKTVKEQFDILANAWRKGDDKKLSELMFDEIGTRMPGLYKRLITDRNRKWLTLIESYMKTPKTKFILVGAGHLVGPDGIIADLKKKGYIVNKL